VLRDAAGALLAISTWYVDDGELGVRPDVVSSVVRDIAARLPIKAPEPLGRHVGVDYRVCADGVFASQQGYLSSLDVPADLRLDSPPREPLPRDVASTFDESEPLPPARASAFRRLLGQLLYAARETHPALMQAVVYCAQFTAAPTDRALRLLCGAASWAAAHAAYGVWIPRVSPERLELVVYTDAAHGNTVHTKPQLGWLILVRHGGRLSLLGWRSFHAAVACKSTTRGELCAIDDAVDALSDLVRGLAPFFGAIKCELLTDSRNATKLLETDNPRGRCAGPCSSCATSC
jgi:hypothetical protein